MIKNIEIMMSNLLLGYWPENFSGPDDHYDKISESIMAKNRLDKVDNSDQPNQNNNSLPNTIKDPTMAQKTTIQRFDDIDGIAADVTIQFSLNGTDYEIDLTHDNAERLRGDFALWVAKGRKVKSGKPGKKTGDPELVARIRKWAAEEGIEINQRGRIPKDVQKQYEASLSA